MTTLKRIFRLFGIAAAIASGTAQAGTVTLKWTAPGDDGYSGRATEYDLRYSEDLINSSNFGQATRVSGITPPSSAGVRESYTIEGLDDEQTYFFAIKTCDDAGNWSGVSNIAVRAVCLHGCTGTRGNINGDPDEVVNICDIQYLIDHLFAVPTGPKPICPLEANANGDDYEQVNISDVNYLVDYLFGSPPGPAPPPCP